MAKPIPLELPRDPREELRSRLENAPADHAEALLAAYEVLQGLYDAGVLELLRGLLSSRDRVLQIAVDAARKPESVQAVRNLLVLAKVLAELDPAVLNRFAKAFQETVQETKGQGGEDPGFLQLLNKLRSQDVRRGLLMVSSLLEAIGRSFSFDAHSESKP